MLLITVVIVVGIVVVTAVVVVVVLLEYLVVFSCNVYICTTKVEPLWILRRVLRNLSSGSLT